MSKHVNGIILALLLVASALALLPDGARCCRRHLPRDRCPGTNTCAANSEIDDTEPHDDFDDDRATATATDKRTAATDQQPPTLLRNSTRSSRRRRLQPPQVQPQRRVIADNSNPEPAPEAAARPTATPPCRPKHKRTAHPAGGPIDCGHRIVSRNRISLRQTGPRETGICFQPLRQERRLRRRDRLRPGTKVKRSLQRQDFPRAVAARSEPSPCGRREISLAAFRAQTALLTAKRLQLLFQRFHPLE